MKRFNNVRAALSVGALGFLAASAPAFSQWGLAGNAIVPGNFLGTTNPQTLDIRTNALTRMTISPTGVVNILNNLRRTVAPIKHRRNSCSMVDKGEMPVADRRSNILAKEECCPFHFIHKERACLTG